MELLRMSSYLAAIISGLALLASIIGFSMFAAVMSELETELENVVIDYKYTSDQIWQDLIHEEQKLGPNVRRQVTDPKCLDGSQPLRASRGGFVKCAQGPCPIGYRCTSGEIPFFRVCCADNKNSAKPRLDNRDSGVTDPKCLDGSQPLRASRGGFVKCSQGPCPVGYRCTAGEIPFFRVCCADNKNSAKPRLDFRDSHGGGGGGGDGYGGEFVTSRPSTKPNGGTCNCITENQCAPGPKGPPGTPGLDGDPGNDGKPGRPGQDGDDQIREEIDCGGPCPRGEKGPRGPKGPGGPRGPPGRKANGSRPGKVGKPGPRGPDGSPGGKGRDGKPGRKGGPGKPGVGGAKGRPGGKGRPGPAGKGGPKGSPGKTGGRASPGSPGRPGPQGKPGARGKPGSAGRPGGPGRPGNDASYCPCPAKSSRRSRFQARLSRSRLRTRS